MSIALGGVLALCVAIALAWVLIVTLGGSHGGHK